MAAIEGFNFPDELHFTADHVWVKVDGNVATIGLTQFGQDIAGAILFVEAPNPGRQITKGEAFMSMESGKWVGRVKAPVSGKILESNGELEWESDMVNKDPYGAGWLTKLEMSNPDELNSLYKADSADLAKLISEEKQKYNK